MAFIHMKLVRNLAPDIECMSSKKDYAYDNVTDVWPLVQILEECEYKGKIMLSGDGSMGKTSSIIDLRLHLLEKNYPYAFFNLKELNHANINIADRSEYVRGMAEKLNASIVILDSFDEVATESDGDNASVRAIAEDLIETVNSRCPQLIIVVARKGTMTTRTSSLGDKVIDCASWLAESGFAIYEMKNFTEVRIRELAGKDCSESMCQLLQNTMCLYLFLSIRKVRGEAFEVENEAKLIDLYFTAMIEDKIEGANPTYKKVVKEYIFGLICEIGKNIYDRSYNRPGHKVDFEDEPILNTIFKQSKTKDDYLIECSQNKYISYCVAKFICRGIMRRYKEGQDIAELFARKDYRNYDLGRNRIYLDGLYMAGQLLQQKDLVKLNILEIIKQADEYFCMIHPDLYFIYLGLLNGEVDLSNDCGIEKFTFDFARQPYLKCLIFDKVDYIGYQGVLCDSLEKVVISNTVTSIIEQAFFGSFSLKEVVVPDSVNEMGREAFDDCRLKIITFYGKTTFAWAESDYTVVTRDKDANGNNVVRCVFNDFNQEDEGIELSNTVGIGAWIFKNCITKGAEPLKYIWWAAFKHNVQIRLLKCKDIEKIEDSVFSYCAHLKKVVLINVRTIGAHAFMCCNSMTSLIMNGTEIIEESAFEGCKHLEEVVIPASVKSMNRAFGYCYSLQFVKIEDGVEEIGEHAFLYCIQLQSIIIPASVKAICRGAFSGCSALKEVIIQGRPVIAEDAFSDCADNLITYKDKN